jgi:hypothetical protein
LLKILFSGRELICRGISFYAGRKRSAGVPKTTDLTTEKETLMQRNIAWTTFTLLSFAVLLAFLVPAAHATNCSMATAEGRYGLSDSGTIIGIGPRAAVGQATFDAEGNVNGNVTASLNGQVAKTALSGTYTVNSDCTGATAFSEFDVSGNLILTATADLVWDDHMREIRFLFTSVVLANGAQLATAVNGNARKLVP